MNQQQTSTSTSKLAAIGILLFVFFLAWQFIALPYLNLWEEKTDEVNFLQQQQSRLQFLIDDSDKIRTLSQQLEQNKTLSDLFLSDKTGALSDAKLQRIVRQLITENGARVIQIVIDNTQDKQAEAASDGSANLESVAVRVVMQGDIKAIYGALHKLENSRPLIILSNLEISHNQTRYQIARSTLNTVYTASYDARAFIL